MVRLPRYLPPFSIGAILGYAVSALALLSGMMAASPARVLIGAAILAGLLFLTNAWALLSGQSPRRCDPPSRAA
jgi:hypothetical protein